MEQTDIAFFINPSLDIEKINNKIKKKERKKKAGH
jgi:hypothetical protein